MTTSWYGLARRARGLVLTLCLACAGVVPAFAAAQPNFFATASGTTNNLTLSATVQVADADVGQPGNTYLAFNLGQHWYFNNGLAWVVYNGGAAPVYAAGPLVDRSMVIVQNADMSPLVGGQLIVGYGLSESDMLANSKFRMVYTVTSERPVQRAPVLLGTSANFAILAKTAVSTVPTSAVTGNVGVSPAAASFVTGFTLVADPSNVFSTSTQVVGGGQVFAANYAVPTPIKLTTAVLDMQTAYTDAAGRPTPDFLNLGSGNMGGLTLAAGLYNWGSTVTLLDDVVISGSANDVWIFQVSGDLIMGAAKRITLSGGALVKNIFWQVAGQATIGTTAHFEGILLSQTAVTLQTGSSMNGRVLAQAMVALDSATVTQPPP